MVDSPANEADDERLRQLLDVEQRLQDLVRAAREDAANRVTAARAASELRLAAAREASERADSEQARAERLIHEAALSEIEAAHQNALATISRLADSRVDELARWAVGEAIARTGDPA